jgi:hypothetical protein
MVIKEQPVITAFQTTGRIFALIAAKEQYTNARTAQQKLLDEHTTNPRNRRKPLYRSRTTVRSVVPLILENGVKSALGSYFQYSRPLGDNR